MEVTERPDAGAEALPEWLWRKQADSGPGAYDTLDPRLRARLKSQIAFLHYYWGEETDKLERRMPWLEHDIRDLRAPLPWILYFFDQNYASGPEMLAALMPAVLAKSPLIITCRVESGPEPLTLGLSAVFELIGQEQVFSINISEAVRLMNYLAAQNAAALGGVIVFGAADWARTLFWAAWKRNIMCLSLPDNPRIAVKDTCKADFELLRWAHPLADIFTFTSANSSEVMREECHAVISDRRDSSDELLLHPLHLQPGCETLWVWPQLSPALFCRRNIGISALKPPKA
jgi:hypothetical protein